MNEELDSVPRTPNPFTSLPSGLPASFDLGADLEAVLAGTGLVNDPFASLLEDMGVDLVPLLTLQLDGLDSARPQSGRRLDYILVSKAIAARGPEAEIYDPMDSGLAGGLPKFGDPLPADTSLIASDHLLVFADLVVPTELAVPTLPLLGAITLAGALVAVVLAARIRAPISRPPPGRMLA